MMQQEIIERLTRLETKFEDYVNEQEKRRERRRRRLYLAISVISAFVSVIITAILHYLRF